MTKESRLKKEYRKNTSKLHKAVGDLITSSILFSNYRIYQEYPVNKISPYFDSGREKFDWVILDLMIIIECHGQQHYKPVRFGGITQEEAEIRFTQQVQRDLIKKNAAIKAGWTYIVFKYNEKDITIESMFAKINNIDISDQISNDTLVNYHTVSQQIKQKKNFNKNSEFHKQQLQKAKEYRKQKYRKQKEKHDRFN